jgi:hypothetical protein
MDFLKNLDLYKVIVLLSVVLLPAGGWWCMHLDEQIELCRKAAHEASRPGGLIEQIGSLQQKVDLVVQNRSSSTGATSQPRTYFDTQIITAAQGGLKPDDFQLNGPAEETVSLGSGKQGARDFIMDVVWKYKNPVKQDFVYALLFNCESGARVGARPGGLQSIWKLRELEFVSAQADKERWLSNYSTPEAELRDEWTIKKIKFARREPRKDTRDG